MKKQKANADLLKEIASMSVEKKSEATSKKSEIMVTGALAEAIDATVEAKSEIKNLEGVLKVKRPVIDTAAQAEMIKQLIASGDHESVYYRTAKGNACTYIMQDRFSKIVFDTEQDKESWIADFETIVGKGKAEEFVDEKMIFEIDPEAVQSDEEKAALLKFVSEFKKSFGKLPLTYKKSFEVKKGSMQAITAITRKSDKIEKAIGMLKPVTQLRGV